MSYISRNITNNLLSSIKDNPVTAIIGARQTGKSTLAKKILAQFDSSLYLDLEKPTHLELLNDVEAFFSLHRNKFVCLDEIQRRPELFPTIRSIVDEREGAGHFFILGSASPELLKQSSESLAGRISYHELSPFLVNEIYPSFDIEKYWIRGGFPRSLLARNDKTSISWRSDFIRTFLERDIRNMGINIPTITLRRLWIMLAHLNGSVLNYSQLGNSLGVNHTTAKKYVEILSNTFMIRILQPFYINIKKRLIKSPKVYISDSGILNALLNIGSYDELFSHPIYGTSWESIVIENIVQNLSSWEPFYFRTSHGLELDLVLVKGNKRLVIECKASTTPKPTKGFWNALDIIQPNQTFIIAPVKEAYPVKNNVWVFPLIDFLFEKIKEY